MKMPDVAGTIVDAASLGDLAALDGIVTQQAAVIAYSNDFLLMTFVSLAAFPLLALIRSSKAAPAASRRGRGGDGLRRQFLGTADLDARALGG